MFFVNFTCGLGGLGGVDGLSSSSSSMMVSFGFLDDFLKVFESLDWKIWEMHGKMEKQEKSLELLEDIKSLLRVFIMNKELNPGDVKIPKENPNSIIGKLFKSKK